MCVCVVVSVCCGDVEEDEMSEKILKLKSFLQDLHEVVISKSGAERWVVEVSRF